MKHLSFLSLTALLLAGCAATTGPQGTAPARHIAPTALAQLQPTRGNVTAGEVRFEQRGRWVRVSGEISGLKPGAEHGFHIHEKGDCSSGDGMSAGGHFNPLKTPHGLHGHGAHHAGDLPSLKADAQGVAQFSFEASGIAVGGGDTDVVGRGLIVHRDPDDYTTQPTGNAGPRLACAVLQRL